MLVREVITLEAVILVTIGIIIMVREKRDLGLRALVSSVQRKDIEPLNVLILARRFKVVEEML